MRRLGWSCGLILVGCVTRAPVWQPRVEMVGCRGEGTEVQLAVPTEADAPLVVLTEIRFHGDQPAQPTIAIWADGRVVFSEPRGGDRELQAELPASAARALARDVFAALQDVPRSSTVEVHYATSGGQLTTITARDGARWRSATVYGAYRDDFLTPGTSGRPEPPREPMPAPAQVDVPIALVWSELRKRPAPAGFTDAYRRLVAAIPARGQPFEAHQREVTFFTIEPDQPGVPPGAPLAWPRDLPAPPAALSPARCDPYKSSGCSYTLAPSGQTALRRLDAAFDARGNNKVIANGRLLAVRLDGLYRGERSIYAVERCRDELVTRAARARRP